MGISLFGFIFLWLLFLNRLMCYSHPENNAGEKKLKEGRRNPTSTQIFVSPRSTVWDAEGITLKEKDAE